MRAPVSDRQSWGGHRGGLAPEPQLFTSVPCGSIDGLTAYPSSALPPPAPCVVTAPAVAIVLKLLGAASLSQKDVRWLTTGKINSFNRFILLEKKKINLKGCHHYCH